MVYMSTNPDNGVRDHGSVLFVMFVSQLFKVFRFAVRSVENFIDQRNEKLRPRKSYFLPPEPIPRQQVPQQLQA